MTRMQNYARLIVRVGANVQKDQPVFISAPVECADFARLLADESYQAGACNVTVRWVDDTLTRLKYLNANDAVFDTFPAWEKALYDEVAETQTAVISVYATDPENLKGVDLDRIRRAGKVQSMALKAYADKQMSNHFPWCVVSVASDAWARKVFPHLPAQEAFETLQNAIFDAARITDDPVAAWEAHVATLEARKEKLNAYRFKTLVYRNALGTDLTVELPEHHVWIAAGERAKTGQAFIANMPTEEIFTLPKRDGVNGVVVASKPLVLNGNVVDDFRFVLEAGKITNIQAGAGLEVLKNRIANDEGSAFLGEVALVPFDSPISNAGILFYNTLFDENASCHFAFGRAYPCFSDADERTKEELVERGMNDSLIHEDFMIGTPDLSIVGITHDGQDIPVFVNGNFAF